MTDRTLHILFTGTREASLLQHGRIIRQALCDAADGHTGPVIVHHGAAAGADTIARIVATRLGWSHRPYPANWQEHGPECGTQPDAAGQRRPCPGTSKRTCRGAGPRRNLQMVAAVVAAAEADGGRLVAVACPGPDSVGTRHCMRAVERAGITLHNHPLTTTGGGEQT